MGWFGNLFKSSEAPKRKATEITGKVLSRVERAADKFKKANITGKREDFARAFENLAKEYAIILSREEKLDRIGEIIADAVESAQILQASPSGEALSQKTLDSAKENFASMVQGFELLKDAKEDLEIFFNELKNLMRKAEKLEKAIKEGERVVKSYEDFYEGTIQELHADLYARSAKEKKPKSGDEAERERFRMFQDRRARYDERRDRSRARINPKIR